MGTRKEYISSFSMTPNQIFQLKEYNDCFRRAINENMSESNLASLLGGVSGILGFVSLIPGATAAGVASAFVGLISVMLPNEKNALVQVIANGTDSLSNIYYTCASCELVEFRAPMLEFVDDKVCVVQGNCAVDRFKLNGVWYGPTGE